MIGRQKIREKLHKRRAGLPLLLSTGVLGILLAAVLLGNSAYATAAVSGVLDLSKTESDDIQWDNLQPDFTLKYWQEFDVRSDQITTGTETDGHTLHYGSGGGEEDGVYDTSIDIQSYDSGQVFELEIKGPDLRYSAEGNPGGEAWWYNNVEYNDLNSDIKWTATYYRTVGYGEESSEEVSLRSALAEFYENKYLAMEEEEQSNYSQSILAVKDDSEYFTNTWLAEFAEENGLTLYNEQSGVSLTQDGNAVTQIEMLTVSNLDIGLYVFGFFDEGRISLDALLATEHTYTFSYGSEGSGTPQQLTTPDAATASGADINSAISASERIVLSNGTDGEGTFVIQYAFGAFEDIPDQQLSWREYSEPFTPDTASQYLYIRSCPVYPEGEGSEPISFVRSETKCIPLRYLQGSPSVTVSPDGSELLQSNGTITLSSSADSSMILYVIGGEGAPQLEEIASENRDEYDAWLESQSSTSGPVLYSSGSEQCLYVNGRWYRLTSAVEEYSSAINVSQLENEADHSLDSVYALAVQEGNEVSAFQRFSWEMQLDTPNAGIVSTQSGAPVNGPLSQEEQIILTMAEEQSGKAVLQYILSSTSIDDLDSAAWTTYSAPISLGAMAAGSSPYLYIRYAPATAGSGYAASEALTVELKMLNSSPSNSVQAAPSSGTRLDVGDSVTVTASGSHAILYVLSGTARTPELTALTASERTELGLGSGSSGEIRLAPVNDRNYVLVNGVWYRCSDDSVQLMLISGDSGTIEMEESLRQDTMAVLYAMPVESGSELGEFSSSFRYYYGMNNQTAAPTSTIATSSENPMEVQMGDVIGLLCTTADSRIFYTTNGSSPVIDASGSDLAPGTGTMEYTSDSPIMVSEDFATYGRNFTITAQAVTYTSYAGGMYRVNRDSEVVRFTYLVGDQAAVEPVQSVPVTTSDSPTEVQAGDMIQLYCETSGVTIYYTTDGSEPTFNEDTGEPTGSTQRYVNGVTVPSAGTNTMFTITAVAYREGLATSEISRLVFRYPEAVSTPYATPASGSVTENTEVELRCSTEDAIIYYEIAYGNSTPSDPTENSSVFDSGNPIRITRRTTIKAFAVSRGMESAIVTFTYEVSTKLATPTPSVDTGTTVPSGTRITLDADSGATVYYTVDGSDPKDPDNANVLVGTTVVLSGDAGSMVVLRTYAAATGYSDSEVGTYSYNISSYDGGIYADVESGSTVRNGDVIHLNTDVSGAAIYYTTDGSVPTQNSTAGSTVTIQGDPGENVIVMAIAVAEGTERSVSSATFTYTIMDKLAAPSASVPDGAVFTADGEVSLTAETGQIYYTTDGTDPTTASNLYRTPILIDEAVTLKAIAVADDYEQSDVSTYTYGFADQVATPTANYASGELEMGTTVTFSCETEGATIYYRTDGVDPDTSNLQDLEVYTGPITVNRATNFKVIAVADHMQDSRVLTVGYTVREPEAVLTEETDETQIVTDTGGRLQSRRSFSDTESGPSFSGIVLRNAVYNVVVSAEEGVLPENVQLQVEQTQVTDAVEGTVRQLISDNYGVVASYDVKLLVDGEEVQPDGEIEIGLPIPTDYGNSLIQVAHVQEDGSAELFDTRRSGGIAYVVTDHLSVYSIAAPTEFPEDAGSFPWLPVVYTLAVALTGLGIFLLYRSRKMKREDREQDE